MPRYVSISGEDNRGVAAGAAYLVLQSRLIAPDYGINGSESARAVQVGAREFPGLGAEQDVFVFSATVDDPAYRSTIDAVVVAARAQPGVRALPAAVGSAGLRRSPPAAPRCWSRSGWMVPRRSASPVPLHPQTVVAAAAARTSGAVRAWVTGYSPSAYDLAAVQQADVARAESVGLPLALVVLLVALGTVVAALVPLALAGAGLLAAFGVTRSKADCPCLLVGLATFNGSSHAAVLSEIACCGNSRVAAAVVAG